MKIAMLRIAARTLALLAATALPLVADDEAARLPAGAGKATFARICGECHGYDSIRKQRLNREAWNDKIDAMIERGAKGSDDEMNAVLEYLTATFGPNGKIWMNTAPFGELKSILKLSNEETQAILDYRQTNGSFRAWSDLQKVPGVDHQKLAAAKDRMVF